MSADSGGVEPPTASVLTVSDGCADPDTVAALRAEAETGLGAGVCSGRSSSRSGSLGEIDALCLRASLRNGGSAISMARVARG